MIPKKIDSVIRKINISNTKKDEMISLSPDTFGGTPVFKGTRVTIESLFQHLVNGISLDEFFKDIPSVSKETAVLLLQFTNDL